MDPELNSALTRGNVVVFFDIAIAGVPQGTIRIELYKNVVPKVKSFYISFLDSRKLSTIMYWRVQS